MAAVEDQRKCWLMLLLYFVYKVCLTDSVQADESGIVERVSRRQTTDVYFFINSTNNSNCADKDTYLINECTCVNDQELLNGMQPHLVLIYTQC